jgi:replicative DNA helicase
MDRQPPSSVEVEKAVLCSFFNSDSVFNKYAYQINPEYFYSTQNRIIFDFMIKNRCTDIMIIGEMFKDDAGYIGEIAENHSSNLYLDAEIAVLKDKYERRKIIQTAFEQVEQAYDNYEIKAAEISDKIISELSGLNTYECNPVHIETIVPVVLETFRRITTEGTALGLKTGISDIDEMIGGFVDSEMVLIAGRPSMGKTSFALQIAAHNAQQGIPVLIFSIETSNEQITGRMLCADAEVSYDDILRCKEITKEGWGRLGISCGDIAGYNIYIDETPSIPVQQLISKAENFVKSKGIRLIISDHIGLITCFEKGRSRNEELGKISKAIKALGKKNKVPTITLCQLSREVEKRSPPIPRLADLYESGSLEQDSDKVIFLYRDEYYNRHSEKKNIAEIILAKNKNGRTGFKEVYFDKPTMTFKNLSNETDPMDPRQYKE